MKTIFKKSCVLLWGSCKKYLRLLVYAVHYHSSFF